MAVFRLLAPGQRGSIQLNPTKEFELRRISPNLCLKPIRATYTYKNYFCVRPPGHDGKCNNCGARWVEEEWKLNVKR